jgi:hypothetical protein
MESLLKLAEVLGPWPTVVLVVGCAFALVCFYYVLFGTG